MNRPNDDTIFFHAPCFDGLISAALACDILETAHGWKIQHFMPVTYGVGDSWLREPMPKRSAIVDFLYHPRASVWIDHHGTTFLNENAQRDYEVSRLNTNRTLIYDPHSPAGAKLLWDHLGSEVSDSGRYAEMVRWATLTDSAGYETAEQAVFGAEPALRIAQTLGSAIDPNRLKTILQALRRGTLDEVAALPLIAEPFARLRPKIEAGLALIAHNLYVVADGIAFYETTVDATDVLPRYGAFLLRPEIRYLVALVHGDRGSKISSSRNPWGPPSRARLGAILRTYGGGGHDAAASLQLPVGNIEAAQRILAAVIHDIGVAETTADPQ
jgi:hypothetical protein